MRILKSVVFSFAVIFLLFGIKSVSEDIPQKIIHIEGGKAFAVQSGFSLEFYGENGGLAAKRSLFCNSVKKPGNCAVFGNIIFLPDENFSVGMDFSGKPEFFGGAFFDFDGNLLYEFPPPEKSKNFGNTFAPERILFLGGKILAAETSEGIFCFDIEEKTFFQHLPEKAGAFFAQKTAEASPRHTLIYSF